MRFLPLGLSAVAAISIVMPLRAAEAPHITQAELTKAIDAKTVVLLDVNGTESYQAAHIPGALNFEAVGGNLKNILPADKKALIVAYCGSEMCGAYKAGVQAAEKLGYTNVKHFAPGIKGWVESGAKTEKG